MPASPGACLKASSENTPTSHTNERVLKTVEVRGVAFEREIGVAWRRGRYFGQAVRLLLEAVFAAYGGRDEWMTKSAAKG